MRADLDTLLTAIYVLLDDFLPERAGPGRPPKITDAELIALAIAQVFLGVANDRQFLGFAIWRLGHLFPYLPQQPGYNKRLRALAPQITRAVNYLAYASPSIFDGLRLLDSTPVPCGVSRETVKRSEFAGTAAYGYCRSHSRFFWGFRLYLLCAAKEYSGPRGCSRDRVRQHLSAVRDHPGPFGLSPDTDRRLYRRVRRVPQRGLR